MSERPRPFTSLLETVAANSLDPGYAAEAARRKGQPRTARERFASRLLALATMSIIGVVVVIAAQRAQASELPAAESRAALVKEIEARTGQADIARNANDRLRQEIGRLRQQAATLPGADAGDEDTLAEIGRLEAQVGIASVVGPGVVIVVDDSDTAAPADSLDPRSDINLRGRVLDRDLQALVNGLWAAGAEAISVGDHRLTSLNAIRAAGEAILVDYRPLLPPYTIRAIGDPDALMAAVETGLAGQGLRNLRDTVGIELTVRPEAQMVLSGAQSVKLWHAQGPQSNFGPGASGSQSRSDNSSSTRTETP